MKFTGNIIIDKQEKSERNINAFKAAMKRLNPDAGFVSESLGNHRGDYALEVEVPMTGPGGRPYVLEAHPDIRVETKWLSERGPIDLFSSCSSGYERLKKEFKFLSTIKAPLFLAQGKESDFHEYTSPGGIDWRRTLNVLFSLNARYRVPMIWTENADEILSSFLYASVGHISDIALKKDTSRPYLVIQESNDLTLKIVEESDEGTQFFCGFKEKNKGINILCDLMNQRRFGFWFFDKSDPAEMAEFWLNHENKSVAIHASGGFTPNPEKYSGAIRTFGPGKNQYLPKQTKTRQKRKACVAFSPTGDDPIFILFDSPKVSGCDIQLLLPKRINGDDVDPRSIIGMKDLAPHSLVGAGKIKDKSMNEVDAIPDVLRRLHKFWTRDEQKANIETGEGFVDLAKEAVKIVEKALIEPEDLPGNPAIGPEMPTPEHFDVGVLPVDYPGVTLKTGMNSVVQKDGKISHYVDGVLVPEIKPETPPVYPPLYQKKTPLPTVAPEPPIIDWMTQISLKLDLVIQQNLSNNLKRNRENIMTPAKSDQNILNTSSPGEVEKALLEVCGLSKASPAMQIVALKMANRYGFSLELKHVIPVKGNLYITRDGLLHIAHKSGQLDGLEVIDEGGNKKDGWWAIVAVHRKDMSKPFKYKGRYNGPNKQFGPEMAIKCAESMALRRAFDVSLCSREERWDVDTVDVEVKEVKEVKKKAEVKKLIMPPLPAFVPAPPPQITIVAAEKLEATPIDMGMTYHDYKPPAPEPSPIFTPSKNREIVGQAFEKFNIPLEYDFDDGTPKIQMLEALAQFYGSDSWALFCPDDISTSNALQFLEFFSWVIKTINFDAAYSLVEQGVLPADCGADFFQEFKKEYDAPDSADVNEIYKSIVAAVTITQTPF